MATLRSLARFQSLRQLRSRCCRVGVREPASHLGIARLLRTSQCTRSRFFSASHGNVDMPADRDEDEVNAVAFMAECGLEERIALGIKDL